MSKPILEGEPTARVPQAPPGVEIYADGIGEERRVVLDIEGTTFELHPDDARVIGECLMMAADEAEGESEGP